MKQERVEKDLIECKRLLTWLILAVLFAGLFTASVNAQELKFGFTPVLKRAGDAH